MLDALRTWLRDRKDRPYLRPWGLAAPVLVLIVCLPLLRPLRTTEISSNELGRLATIQAIVEQKTLAIDHTSFPATKDRINQTQPAHGPVNQLRQFSKQPPVLAALLAGPYWLMHRMGITFQSDLALTSYLLTLLGATLPVAAAAGLVYRLSRIFELKRPMRMILAIAAVFGSGLVSYATVLNSHAPAAALVLASCGCLWHATSARRRVQTAGWLWLAGLCAAFAAVIDVGALVFLVLLVGVILAMRWPASSRVVGIGWYALGAMAPIFLHALLTIPITGDLRPGFLHAELATLDLSAPAVDALADPDDEPPFISQAVLHLADGVLWSHGLISHFPILLMGIAGIGTVLHRNWPAPIKMMAVVSLLSGVLIIALYVVLNADWDQPMFSVRWFILFVPLIVFWSGAWMRKPHHPVAWTAAATVLAFSMLTTLLGATAPFTPARSGEYTAYAAARQLLKPPPPLHIIANR